MQLTIECKLSISPIKRVLIFLRLGNLDHGNHNLINATQICTAFLFQSHVAFITRPWDAISGVPTHPFPAMSLLATATVIYNIILLLHVQ